QGKSLLACRMSSNICHGQAFAGKAVTKGPVLYLDAELDLDEFTRRAYRVARGMGLEKPPEGLHYLKLERALGDEAEQQVVLGAVAEFKPVIVVLDSLTVASYDVDVREAQAMTEALK